MKIHAQDVHNSRVRDVNGKIAGRIHATLTEIRGDECVILEWHLGPVALLARLGISAARLAGWPLKREPLRVPWDQLDLTNPEEPRLLCSLEELKEHGLQRIA